MICTVQSKNRTELIDITTTIQDLVAASRIGRGLCMLYVPHTTAAITINESADPSVKDDILMVINTIVPWKAGYRHMEGNSPAHVKSTLIGSSELIAVENDRLVLGTWQGIFFCEFDGPRRRRVMVEVISGD
jgi:secondary thiamine-phosphate synthase enzyme